MNKATVGAALGATGATVYLRPDILLEWLRNATRPPSAVGSNGMIYGQEMEQLSKMVRLYFVRHRRLKSLS